MMNLFFVAHVNNGIRLFESKEQIRSTARFLRGECRTIINSGILSSNESAVFADVIKRAIGVKKKNKKVAWLNYRNYADHKSRFEITDRLWQYSKDRQGLKNIIIIARADNIKTMLDVLVNERSFRGDSIPLSEYRHGTLLLADKNARTVAKLFEPSFHH